MFSKKKTDILKTKNRGLIGKEKGAPVRLWLPDDEPLCAFPNINMQHLLFRKRDAAAKKNRRESVQVKSEAKPTTVEIFFDF